MIPYKFLIAALLLAILSSASFAQEPWLSSPAYDPGIPQVPGGSMPTTGPLKQPPPPLSPQAPSVFDEPEVSSLPGSALPGSSLPGSSQPGGPVWYVPWSWIPMDGWENSAELGINGSAGNAESFSFQTGARFKRKSDFTLFDLRITHNRTNAAGIETQNNALMFADWEKFIQDSKWTYFVKNGLEYDEFKAFDLRYNINSGLGYNLVNTDDLTLKARFGAGASREFGGPNNAWSPEALFGGDYEHQVTNRHKLIAKIDYFPEWSNFANFRLIGDVAWEYLLDEEGNLSFKLGANDRYDSTPNGRKANDINYNALLLYKF